MLGICLIDDEMGNYPTPKKMRFEDKIIGVSVARKKRFIYH
jgi:hypothetical protein